MSEYYNPEQQAIEQAEAAKAADQQAMDARMAQAEPAKLGSSVSNQELADAGEMQSQLADQSYSAAVEADRKMMHAAPVGDNFSVGDTAESTIASGQMTDTPHFNQGNHPDCLLQSARMAETRQTGRDPGLETYKQEAITQDNYFEANGLGGVGDMEKFTEQLNQRPELQAEFHEKATLEQMKSELDQGNSVIAGVDASEFYPDLGLPPDSGGHAVVVTGANSAPGGEWNITVNDSNELGPNTSVEGNVFKRAWDAMDNPMIVVSGRGGAA